MWYAQAHLVHKQNPTKKDISHNALALTINDAVTAANNVTSDMELTVHRMVSRRPYIPVIFKASQDAVAKAKPGKINPRVFNTALGAANAAMDDSTILFTYDKMHKIIMSVPDHLVSVAAKHAANDLFTSMTVETTTSDGRRLLEDMKDAAIKAARAHLRRDECMPTLQAATRSTDDMAKSTVLMTAEIVQTGVSAYAATSAVFGAAIRKVPSGRLTRVIEEACTDLPKLARRYGIIVGMVAELSTMIYNDARYRRKYQTAIRGAEKLSKEDVAVQVAKMITGNTFGAVYGALIIGVYAISDRSTFESGYKEALAAACGVKSFNMPQATMMDIDNDSTANLEDIPPEVLQELYQRLSNKMASVLGSEKDPASRRLYMNASDVDYKAEASRDWSNGIVSLYKMAYRAAYKGAGAAAGKSNG